MTGMFPGSSHLQLHMAMLDRNCEKWYEVASLRTEQPETIKMKALLQAMHSVPGQTDCECMEVPAGGRQQKNGQQYRLFVCCFVG